MISTAAWIWRLYLYMSYLRMCLWINACLQAFASSLSPVLWPPAESHVHWQKKREIFLSSSFSSYLSIFIHLWVFSWPCFWSYIILCLRFEVEGRGCNGSGGWRQDTDLNCDDSSGFLPLTSSTLFVGEVKVWWQEVTLKTAGEFVMAANMVYWKQDGWLKDHLMNRAVHSHMDGITKK